MLVLKTKIKAYGVYLTNNIISYIFIFLEPDTDAPQEMGNCNDDEPVELTDEQMDAFNDKRSEAMAAFSEASWQQAADLFTEAIKINSGYVAKPFGYTERFEITP